MPRILIVDDDRDIRDPLLRFFRENKCQADGAASPTEARKLLQNNFYHVILLDIMMPGENGLTFCRELRQSSNIPVIFLTARKSEIDRVLGFEMGADDYICKPFKPRELLARVEALIRRASAPAYSTPAKVSQQYRFGDWAYNGVRCEITDNEGVVLSLSSTENKILAVFMRYPGAELSRQAILQELHGQDSECVFDRSIDTQISRLRRKLGKGKNGTQYINTIWGSGYIFSAKIEGFSDDV